MLVLIGRSETSQNGIREKYQNGKAMFCVFFIIKFCFQVLFDILINEISWIEVPF